MRQSPRASISSIVRREIPLRFASALMDNPAALRRSLNLIMRVTVLYGRYGVEDQGEKGQPQGCPHEPVKRLVLQGVDQVKRGQQVNTETFGDVLEKAFYHLDFAPFVVYNRAGGLGRLPSPYLGI